MLRQLLLHPVIPFSAPCRSHLNEVLCICTLSIEGESRVPRPRKHRNCRRFDGDQVFKPRSIPMSDLEIIRLEIDELEAMRLCDLEGHDQKSAGERMGVSRGTVQRLVKSGREKLLRALVDSSAVVIERGELDANLHTHAG